MDQHFDAERLAAFADGSLSSAERVAAEAHAADCPHCLQLLAAMARTHEEPPRPSRAGWRLPVFVRWAAPLAAAATGLALWFNVMREPPPEPVATEQAKVSVPQAVADEAKSAEKRPPQAPRDAEALKFDQKAGQTATLRDRKESSSPRVQEEKREAFDRLDKQAEAADPSAQFSARREAAKRAPEEKAPAPAPLDTREVAAEVPRPAAPPPQGAPASMPGKPQPPPTVPASSTSAAAKPAAAAPPSALAETVTIEPAADNVAGASGLRQRRLSAVAAIEAFSPDRRYRWRVNGVVVERSTDAGATWVALSGMPGAQILAIASPGPTTAWFVGRAGAVFVFSESNWARVTFPESIDLTAVRAMSAREALVTTVDGRTFRTSDGGQTWSLQESPPPAF